MIGAQLVHAAGESSTGNLPVDTHAVVLSTNSEIELLGIEKCLQEHSIQHKSIRESDEPYSGSLMSIGIFPCQKSTVRKLLSSLPLLK